MVDVEIEGGGIFGLSVAFACARRGARVRLHERRRIGAGASGGVVGALAPHTPDAWNEKKQFQLESLAMAPAFWAQVAELSGLDPGYARLGRLMPLATERAVALARGRIAEAERNWRGIARWSVVDTAAPWKLDSPTGYHVSETLSARLHPRAALKALAAAARALGAEIEEGATRPVGRGRAVVEATGWEGLVALGQETGVEVGSGVKGQAALLRADFRRRPQLFVDGLHIVPHADGTTAIGSTSERSFAHPDATDAALDELLERARRICPELASVPVIGRWAGVRPRAATRAPLLGPHPRENGRFIANGGFKIGFGVAPLVGEVMADLVLEGRAERIPEAFRTERLFAG